MKFHEGRIAPEEFLFYRAVINPPGGLSIGIGFTYHMVPLTKCNFKDFSSIQYTWNADDDPSLEGS